MFKNKTIVCFFIEYEITKEEKKTHQRHYAVALI